MADPDSGLLLAGELRCQRAHQPDHGLLAHQLLVPGFGLGPVQEDRLALLDGGPGWVADQRGQLLAIADLVVVLHRRLDEGAAGLVGDHILGGGVRCSADGGEVGGGVEAEVRVLDGRRGLGQGEGEPRDGKGLDEA